MGIDAVCLYRVDGSTEWVSPDELARRLDARYTSIRESMSRISRHGYGYDEDDP